MHIQDNDTQRNNQSTVSELSEMKQEYFQQILQCRRHDEWSQRNTTGHWVHLMNAVRTAHQGTNKLTKPAYQLGQSVSHYASTA